MYNKDNEAYNESRMSDYLYFEYLNVPIVEKNIAKADQQQSKQDSITSFKNEQQMNENMDTSERSESPLRNINERVSFNTPALKHKYEILKLKSLKNIHKPSIKGDDALKKKLSWDKEGPAIEVG